MEKRVLMLATTAAMIEQFNKNNIALLNDMGFIVDMIGNFDKGNPISDERLNQFRKWISERGGICYNYSATRNPLDVINNYKAYKKAVEVLTKNRYTFIHCHNPIGAVIGRLAGHNTRTKVVYTAHGFHFYDGAPVLNWLLYYPVEKFLSRYTDTLITINREDYKRASEKFHAQRVRYIPGVGVDTNRFGGTCSSNDVRKSLGIKCDDIVLLSVGELNKNKNHGVVIKALSRLKKKNIYYIIVGKGKLEARLKQLAVEENVASRVKIVGFQDDIKAYYEAADIYVLPSIREGLNVSLMEAMACGLPCIVGDIRGNKDLIDVGEGGYLFDVTSVEDLAGKIKKLLNENRYYYGTYNLKKIQKFDVKVTMKTLKSTYLEITSEGLGV